jgi:hypothetical protein
MLVISLCAVAFSESLEAREGFSLDLVRGATLSRHFLSTLSEESVVTFKNNNKLRNNLLVDNHLGGINFFNWGFSLTQSGLGLGEISAHENIFSIFTIAGVAIQDKSLVHASRTSGLGNHNLLEQIIS